MSSRRRVSVFFAFAGAVSAGAFAGITAAPGCGAQPCTSNTPNLPSTSLECPAGELCYLGECFRSCSAGQELAQECTTDDDCDTARPNCIAADDKGRFCSACEGFEVCVPTLNICRDVSPVEYPETPPPVMPSMIPYPLDGGFEELDGGVVQFGGIKRRRDGGVVGPQEPEEFTIAGFWDVYEEVDLRGGQRVETSGNTLRVFDVSGVGRGIKWRADFPIARVEQTLRSDELNMLPEDDPNRIYFLDQCTVRDLVPTSSVVASRPQKDIGDMLLDDLRETEDAMRGTLRGTYDMGQGLYLTQRELVLDGRILNFSRTDPFETLFVTLSGNGADETTDGPWPDWDPSEFRGFHVPFELIPSMNTMDLIDGRVNVTMPATADLDFTWNYVQTGADNKERVIARISGNRTELFCSDTEGSMGVGRVVIRAAALDEFIRREGNAPGTYELVFERASVQAPLIIGVNGELIDFSVRIRHSFVQAIQFQ